MIKNDRQYRITRAQIDKLGKVLEQTESADVPHNVHPVIRKAEIEALSSQLAELREELRDYEAAQTTPVVAGVASAIEVLPETLIRARISKGWSQKDLAERLGFKEQQIQRYEATDYATANLARIREVARALDLFVENDSLASPTISLRDLLRKLRTLGIEWNPLIRRLMPVRLAAELSGRRTDEDVEEIATRAIASRVSRVFGWPVSEILQSGPLELDPSLLTATKFKLPKRVNELRLTAYATYAHYLAELVVDASSELVAEPVPRSPSELKEQIEGQSGVVSLATVLKYAWDTGIRVLPLRDPGSLHGACWQLNGATVVVLNQTNTLPALWLFDLLHELWHAADSSDSSRGQAEQLSIDVAWDNRWDSPDEQAAGQFAGDVVLGGRAEELAKLCAEAAGGSVERLKGVVPEIARTNDVSVSALAYYLAFRLSLQKVNWWGAATNLQEEGDAWSLARDELMKRIDIMKLSIEDREMLLEAMRDPALEVDYALH